AAAVEAGLVRARFDEALKSGPDRAARRTRWEEVFEEGPDQRGRRGESGGSAEDDCPESRELRLESQSAKVCALARSRFSCDRECEGLRGSFEEGPGAVQFCCAVQETLRRDRGRRNAGPDEPPQVLDQVLCSLVS